MMKKGIKILGIILIIGIIINAIAIINTKCYAADGMGDVTENPIAWQPTGGNASRDLNTKINVIATVIRIIGIIASVGTLMVIGIKFMLGSVDEKAQYKQTLVPWVIGAFLVFAMTNIPTLIFNITNELFN